MLAIGSHPDLTSVEVSITFNYPEPLFILMIFGVILCLYFLLILLCLSQLYFVVFVKSLKIPKG
jgi:hypothetical protein